MFTLAPANPARSDLEWCWFLRGFGKAGDAIERALYKIGVMDHTGWARWQHSALTETGAPVAVQFSTHDQALSVITEVENPAQDPKMRLSTACKMITALGGEAPETPFREVISAAQGSSPLTFGARLGLRHDNNALHLTLYVELPEGASDMSGLLSHSLIGADHAANQNVTMLAYDVQTKHVTLFSIPDTETLTQLPAVCARKQPVATRRKLGTEDTAYKVTQNDISSADTEILAQLTSLKQRVHQRHACLIDHLQTTVPNATFRGDIWISEQADGETALSIDIAAPWIGCDQPH
ncbi:hypothetical protein DS901_00545 [Loktanella sp. D2R18]|uniref:hypothetical protein n=1 Tax=Rhodobacterales TaxID=204455 RepID=UPI000DE8C36B|nr:MULTISPECIES: hypothetical protein [Rhodobacterales]MDO6591283.1 hypothetical protein [Yoonia sp. 1_MG-2023]RBW46238.1 hypothetical protein DS901_00545 [Loktanella sp. D2R18]